MVINGIGFSNPVTKKALETWRLYAGPISPGMYREKLHYTDTISDARRLNKILAETRNLWQ